MTIISHAVVSGAIVSSFPQNPALGLSLSFVSHPLMDLIPHWDFGYKWRQKTKIRLFIESALDFVVGISLAYLLFGQQVKLWYFAAGLSLVLIWDVVETPYWLLDWHIPPFSWVYNIQSKMHSKTPLPWGVLTQAATVVGAVVGLQIIT